MINNAILSLANESKKDDRNVVSKKSFNDFITSHYFNGRVENVVSGTAITRYDVLTDPKSINYFLSLRKTFNAYFDTNDCRVFQNGKHVCVEVPNKYRGTYGFRDCLRTLQQIPDSEQKLMIPIGESLDGTCITYNLCDMPHLLVAGQTGSGKSVFLHNLILSLISQYGSKNLNLVLVDPKQVEFEFYRGVPCVREVVTTTERAEQKINDLCQEMDNRYRLFSELKVRDINSYNSVSDSKLPRIVLFVDELADLAITSKDTVISNIQRLVLKARACGVYVVLSTQRPDSDFMTGKMKNNFQCRAIFTMASTHDGRTVGMPGAHNLKGNGDGLFRSNDGRSAYRFQAPLITEKEIKDVVNFVIGRKNFDN